MMEKVVYVRRLARTYKIVKVDELTTDAYKICYRDFGSLPGYLIAYWKPCGFQSIFTDLAKDSIGFNCPPHTRVLEKAPLLQNLVFQTRNGGCYRDFEEALSSAGSAADVAPLAIYSILESLPEGGVTLDTYIPILFRVDDVYFRCPSQAEQYSREGPHRLVVRMPVVSSHIPFGDPVSRSNFTDPFTGPDEINAV